MKIKTSELIDVALDWAVLFARNPGVANLFSVTHCVPAPFSTEWALGGEIVEQEKIEWQFLPSSHKAHRYGARKPSLGGLNRTFCMDGPTILIAAMRCYVASKLGDEVEIPEELTVSKS